MRVRAGNIFNESKKERHRDQTIFVSRRAHSELPVIIVVPAFHNPSENRFFAMGIGPLPLLTVIRRATSPKTALCVSWFVCVCLCVCVCVSVCVCARVRACPGEASL